MVIWNFFVAFVGSRRGNFTRYPHLTLGITARGVEVMVTVPNAVNRGIRRHIKALGETGFQALTTKIVQNMTSLLRRHPGMTPWFRGVQRRYPSQRAIPYVDAIIDFDLRTALDASNGPKAQSRWLEAGYGAFIDKEGSNYQIQPGAMLRYERCPELQRADAINLIAGAWLACKSLVDLGRQ